MPEKPNPRTRVHPKDLHQAGVGVHTFRRDGCHREGYAELHCKSNFSFLRGASHPEELAEWAKALGYSALAITDHNTLAGVVRMHCAAKTCGLKLIIGAEITPVDAPPILLYAPDRAAYGRLSRIITEGRLREKKGECAIRLEDIAKWAGGMIGAVVPTTSERDEGTKGRRDEVLPPQESSSDGSWFKPTSKNRDLISLHLCAGTAPSSLRPFVPSSLTAYRDIFSDRLYLAASVHGGSDDARWLAQVDAVSRAACIPMLATNDVHYHAPHRRFLQDVLTCIRQGCTLEEAGTSLFSNAERHLKSAEAMQRLFADYPDAIARTLEIADRCTFTLDELRYEYPEALCPPGRAPNEFLTELTWKGAREHYPSGIPGKIRNLIEHELQLIGQLAYEPYFLTVWDIVNFARSQDILCQGRGSAANSVVCYCLGITSVDPDRVETLFERFVSAERNEPPDIDVDFEHERREEVFQYIYNKYGRDHAGIVAEVITYRPRSAVRDVGKALGLSLDRVDALAKKHEWWDFKPMQPEFLRECGLDPGDRMVRQLGELVPQILGFPRHLSQHVGGFVITRGPLCEMVPIENGAMPNRTFIEWDKDDIDALGILKVDCLALGMLTAIQKCLKLLRDEGTEGHRDEGKGHRMEANAEGTAASDHLSSSLCLYVPTSVPSFHLGESDEETDFSGFDCLEEERRLGEGCFSDDAGDARCRAIRPISPDAPSGGVDSIQYRRGKRKSNLERLSSLPEHVSRFSRGTRNADHDCTGVGNDQERVSGHGRIDGSGSSSAGFDSQSPNQGRPEGLESGTCIPLSLRPCVPASLRPFVQIPTSLLDFPPEDPVVYDMICRADTIGIFQIESRAQMSMLPRLKPRCYYDLVIEVAIVRPGPIQGGMVHPYLRRRNGEEEPTYPSEAIREVLQRTLGVPLFQEQAMRLAIVAAGFTPGEADQLRRAMAAWRRDGEIEKFRTKLITGMIARGLSQEFANRCFEQICGFGEYGFPESHAASFALLVYASAWLKRYHPAAFCAAILNSQPMGFYQPAQLVRDALEHGVPVLPIDVNFSGYDCRLEARDEGTKGHRDEGEDHKREVSADGAAASDHLSSSLCRSVASSLSSTWGLHGPAVRLGMRLIKGISQAQVAGIERAQKDGSFRSIADLAHRSGAGRTTLARLAAADAFRSLGLDRRQAVWKVLALGVTEEQGTLFAGLEPEEAGAPLPKLSTRDVVLTDYNTFGLSLNAHPISLIREDLNRVKVQPNKTLQAARNGVWIRVAGIVLVRQRPSTANGIVFFTIEDETGIANLVVRPHIYTKHRQVAAGAAAIIVDGRVERVGEVIHVNAQTIRDATRGIAELQSISRDFQ